VQPNGTRDGSVGRDAFARVEALVTRRATKAGAFKAAMLTASKLLNGIRFSKERALELDPRRDANLPVDAREVRFDGSR
jgi:hypothetical protein